VDYLNALRARDAAHAVTVADLAAQHARDQTDAEHAMDDLRRQLRAGDLRLRARFQCASPAVAGGLPDTGAGAVAGGADGTAHAGLGAADAEFLVRIVADGDAAIRERNLAVAVAEQYRAACSAPAAVTP